MTRYTFQGYRRENGRVGIRNHVILLALDDLSNAACEAVANNVKGTLAMPHAYGRLQFGADLDLFFRTLIGTGRNPNVAACIVIGIEPGWTERVMEGIATTGKPVCGFAIERKGDIQTVADASRVAQRYLQEASEQQRTPCDIADLWVAYKCGESDTTSGLAANPTCGWLVDRLDSLGVTQCFGETSEITGAELLCAQRAATPEVAEKFLAVFNAYQNLIEQHKSNDLSESQPTRGNIAGGLTTIEEKALGNLQKIGRKARYIDVLRPAEEPSKGPGLYFMDTSSAAAECLSLQAAAGFTVHVFPTGQGNVVGHPIMPVIKLTANPRTAHDMTEHIDLDLSAILRREIDHDQAGESLMQLLIRTCNGRLTCAETLGHREFVLTRLYPSA